MRQPALTSTVSEDAKARLWDCNVHTRLAAAIGLVSSEDAKARLWDCN